MYENRRDIEMKHKVSSYGMSYPDVAGSSSKYLSFIIIFVDNRASCFLRNTATIFWSRSSFPELFVAFASRQTVPVPAGISNHGRQKYTIKSPISARVRCQRKVKVHKSPRANGRCSVQHHEISTLLLTKRQRSRKLSQIRKHTLARVAHSQSRHVMPRAISGSCRHQSAGQVFPDRWLVSDTSVPINEPRSDHRVFGAECQTTPKYLVSI